MPGMSEATCKKVALLKQYIDEQVAQNIVNVDVITSLVGIWLYGSLLSRNILPIPHDIFSLFTSFEIPAQCGGLQLAMSS